MSVTTNTQRRATVAQLCVDRVGVVSGTILAFRLLQWAIVSEDIGRFATTFDYAAWTAGSQRTAERHSAIIRKAFTEDEFRAIVDELIAADVARLSRAAALELQVAV